MTEPQESLHFLDYWRVIRARKEIVIAVFLLIVLAGIATTMTMPKVYMALTKILVRRESPDVDVFRREITPFDPLFLRTQFEIIQSRSILEEVISELNLDEKLGRAYGYLDLPERAERTWKLLRQSMKVQQCRDTNLVEIQVELKDPLESASKHAAEIANKIAEVFKDRRMAVSREETERGLDAVLESLEEQKKKVVEHEKKVADIRQKYKIDVVRSVGGTDSALAKQSLILLETERIRARMELTDREARYRKIESLPHEILLDAAPYVVGDPALSSLVSTKRKSEIELSKLREAYGPKHPDVIRTKAVIVEIEKKIEDALNGLKIGVQAAYEFAKQKSESLEKDIEALKSKERKAQTGEYREFDEALDKLDQARKMRDILFKRYIEEGIQLSIPRTIVEVIEEARPITKPVRPKILLNIILSIVLGMVSGVGLAFFAEYLDTSVKTIEEVEHYMGIPVLGVVPQKVKPLTSVDAKPSHGEVYRILRTNVQFSKKLEKGNALCVTSGSMSEGKSLTVFNLAYVCAQFGDNVLVVDSDLHRPKQHKMMNVDNSVGLANVLMGDATIEDAVIATAVPHLYFMPSGRLSASTPGLLNTRIMEGLIGKLKETYDYVFFDAPPAIGISDASLIAREVDGVLLVVQHRKYPKEVSLRARDILNNAGANIIGVVLNNINISRDYSAYYYNYTSYYQYSKKK
ncbi:GumC family protein [Verrucomicrobiota bacterium]